MSFRLTLAVALMAPALAAAQPAHSPYAGQEARAIKSLSAEEVDDLLAGRGMGLAKAAELNGYPGPLHALELAAPLGLEAGQVAALEAIRARMAAAAQDLGARIVEAERHLDRLFAERRIDPASLERATAEIAEMQGRLRAVHLAAHLETRALLTERQLHRYDELRGYAGAGSGAPPHGGGYGHGGGHGASHGG